MIINNSNNINSSANEKTAELETKFKELYIKAERLATYRMGFEYDTNANIDSSKDFLFNHYSSNLYNNYKINIENMKEDFDSRIKELDIIKHFTTNKNNGNIGLVEGSNNLNLLTFFDRSFGSSVNDNNLNSFKSAIQSGNGFSISDSSGSTINSDVTSLFDSVSKKCNKNPTCKSLFKISNSNPNDKNYPKYSLIKNNDDDKLHFIINYSSDVTDNGNNNGRGTYYFTFKKNTDNGEYTINPYDSSIDFISSTDLSNESYITKLNGHNKKVSNDSNNQYIKAYGLDLIDACDIKLSVKNDYNQEISIFHPIEYRVNDDRLNGNAFYSEVVSYRELNTPLGGYVNSNDPNSYIIQSNLYPNEKNNILCSYYNNKYDHIETISKNFLEEKNKLFNDNKSNNSINRIKKLIYDIEGIKKEINEITFDSSNTNDNLKEVLTLYYRKNPTLSNTNLNKKVDDLFNEINNLKLNEVSKEEIGKEMVSNNIDELNSLIKENLCKKYKNEYTNFKNNYINEHNI
ncbi:hypothetical protein BCR36DRAFT_369730 [Piromyces finnis]|uniref:Uncharacterized protein n=1 Tax=Piromyces finnis TaxID=1754191 RepID=A0A1Y1VB87_9FUNG|nr:hypothetical protein BCR36DRAFT_369730 [Piromyces finnis]|eukprot:ORX51822.1 hypothetical protein BCR36DRAFT_369730 [Piromyces finnis]